jgi:hypothetical protein
MSDESKTLDFAEQLITHHSSLITHHSSLITHRYALDSQLSNCRLVTFGVGIG